MTLTISSTIGDWKIAAYYQLQRCKLTLFKVWDDWYLATDSANSWVALTWKFWLLWILASKLLQAYACCFLRVADNRWTSFIMFYRFFFLFRSVWFYAYYVFCICNCTFLRWNLFSVALLIVSIQPCTEISVHDLLCKVTYADQHAKILLKRSLQTKYAFVIIAITFIGPIMSMTVSLLHCASFARCCCWLRGNSQ